MLPLSLPASFYHTGFQSLHTIMQKTEKLPLKKKKKNIAHSRANHLGVNLSGDIPTRYNKWTCIHGSRETSWHLALHHGLTLGQRGLF